jgi:hypothetical protein
MRWITRVRVALAALALLGFTLAAPSAPVPRPGGPSVPRLEKYLLDDADFVLLVNVKQVLSSPMYKKSFEKPVEEFLKQPAAQAILKDAGFDPLKDIGWVAIYAGRSCHPRDGMPPGFNSGPVFALHGKFDGAKLHAKMAQLAKENPGQVQVHKLGGTSWAGPPSTRSRAGCSWARASSPPCWTAALCCWRRARSKWRRPWRRRPARRRPG